MTKNELKELIKEEYHNVKQFMEEKYGFTPELGKVIDNPYVTAFKAQDYLEEGDETDAEMAVDQLETSIEKARQLIDKLRGKSNLEPWVQALITKAEDYLSTVSDYGATDELSEGLRYHVKNNIPLYENEYRMYSKKYFEVLREARTAYKNGKFNPTLKEDIELLESDLGKFAKYEGKNVPLDLPLVEAEYQGKDVQLNKPMRNSSGPKFKVYVKDPKSGNIRKITFGASGGGGSLAVKLKDPAAKKAFAARHNCEQTKDKTTASYWSCRLPRYAKSLGLSGGGQWW